MGGTSRVVLVRWCGQLVACKRFEPLGPQQRELLKWAVESEGYLMSTLRHPNIVQLYGEGLCMHGGSGLCRGR